MFSLLVVLGCSRAPDVAVSPHFVRGGVVIDGVFTEGSWSAGDVFAGATAPSVPECVALFEVPLGDVSRQIAMGGEAPDTALAFSPDGSVLAIGSYRGEVMIVDGWTGEVRARRRLAETMVKHLAWSDDGAVLFAAEQSPDAFVLALEPGDLSTRALVRLADWIASSSPPPGDDLYGVYTLPSAYWLHALPDGGLLVAAAHGWNDAEGVRLNKSVVMRLDASLETVAIWPPEGFADAVFLSAVTDQTGARVAVSVSRSAEGGAESLPINGLTVLSTKDLSLLGTVSVPPLAPWYDRSFIWEAIGLDDDRVFVGLGDGRVVVTDLDGVGFTHDLGTPILAGDVPIAASVGRLIWSGDRLYVLTARSGIPFGAAAPELRPTAMHPNANTLFAFQATSDRLVLDWTWRGPHHLQGMTLVGDTLIVGAGARMTDDRTDLFGALLFHVGGGGDGASRLQATCETQGPVFFRHGGTVDGRIAVAEVPRAGPRGVLGAYRVVVFR